ncbi:hypothetical protein LG275_12595 [Chryseomicrobium palamuruense]
MKRIYTSFALVSILTLAACGTTQPEAQPEEQPEVSQGSTAATSSEIDVTSYQPSKTMTKVFSVAGTEMIREVVEVRDNQTLEIISFGDVRVGQISSWNANEMAFTFNQTVEVADPTIAALTSDGGKETIISPEGTDWLIIEEDAQLEAAGQTFTDVLVVEQAITSEVTEEVTRTLYYFAPDYGLVQEEQIIEADGEEQITRIELVEIRE